MRYRLLLVMPVLFFVCLSYRGAAQIDNDTPPGGSGGKDDFFGRGGGNGSGGGFFGSDGSGSGGGSGGGGFFDNGGASRGGGPGGGGFFDDNNSGSGASFGGGRGSTGGFRRGGGLGRNGPKFAGNGTPDPSGGSPTPLVLVFDDDAIAIARQWVVFDFYGTGKREVPWVRGNVAFLARDLDGSGCVESGAELFGDATWVGQTRAPHGFAALQDLDDNHDGIIDRNDRRFSELRLWKDKNLDAVCDPGEFIPMRQVVSLSVRFAVGQRLRDRIGYYLESEYRYESRGKILSAPLLDVYLANDRDETGWN